MSTWLLAAVGLALLLLLAWRGLGLVRWRRRAGAVELVLSGPLADLPAPGGLRSWLRPAPGPDLVGLLALLDTITRDPKIESLIVRIEHLQCGLGRAEELRSALARCRDAGKTVIVHADELGLAGYWLALGASSIRLPPTGSLNVSGVAMEFTLLQGALERAGVRAQLLARGEYKSMREMFTAARMSDENREMLTSLVGDLNRQLVERCAAARNLSLEAARTAIDSGPFRAEEALACGLIDTTQYVDQLADEVGVEEGKVWSASAYRRALRRGRLWRPRPVPVALLGVTGNIRSGHDRAGPNGPRATGHLSFRRALRRAVASPKLRAIVLRVDSPGGSALASDLMWRELTLAAKKKPIFVSMVNIAASGGYYTSALPGVRVWANPSTLTGSIGVVGGKFEVSQLLSKLGIGRETIGSGPRAGFHAVTTPWSAEELDKVEHDIEAAYRDFVTKMAQARGMPFETLERVARGRVWTGSQALETSLVDALGGLWDVQAALREKLSLATNAPIRWVQPGATRGLRPRREEDAGLAIGAWLGAHVPGVSDALELATDLAGERLFALSPIYPTRHGR